MFDDTSGKYTGSDHTIELQKKTKPYHAYLLPSQQRNGMVYSNTSIKEN